MDWWENEPEMSSNSRKPYINDLLEYPRLIKFQIPEKYQRCSKKNLFWGAKMSENGKNLLYTVDSRYLEL